MTTLVNLGAAGAVIITISLFLAHLRKAARQDSEERGAERLASRQEREEERALLVGLIKNDLAHVGETLHGAKDELGAVVHSLNEVTGGLKDVVSELKRRD
jgi:archaellum component FlaC